jgi:putative membrane protein insertion efficiency factor
MIKKVIVFLLLVYKKLLSPLFVIVFGEACCYRPTCSQYAYEAIDKKGIVRGTVLSIKRFVRCSSLAS